MLRFRGSDCKRFSGSTWYVRIDNFLTSFGFSKIKYDSKLYYKVEEGSLMILLLYLDDLFVTVEDGLIANTKRKLATEFEMKHLGMMHYFLGMEVWQNLPGTRKVSSIDIEEVLDDGP